MLDSAAKEVGRGAILEVADFIQNSPHERADLLRKRRDPITMLRPSHTQDYLDMARESLPQGPATPPERINGVSPEAAWSLVLDTLRSSLGFQRPAGPWHPNPHVHEAIEHAYKAVGKAAAIGRADDFTRREMSKAFQAAFAREYHA